MVRSWTEEQLIGQKLFLSFEGKDWPNPEITQAIREYKPGGVTLFRALNIDHPAQVLEFTEGLQQAARDAGLPPLLVGVDQEGGQLMAIGEGATPLPGNLALGAAGSLELAYQAGEVLGRELAAMGIQIDYAPCCDINSNPQNPVVGTRSFGEDPQQVAGLSSAMTNGIQSTGVVATAKHFPGHGDTATDSHYGIPVIPHSLEHLRQVEFVPFSAAIQAGVRLVMTSHLALPAIEGRSDLPATLSPRILKGVLREQLGFKGVSITDAMDMSAIQQGEYLGQEAVRAAAAGMDLILLGANPDDQRRVSTAILQAQQAGQVSADEINASLSRISSLKEWVLREGQTPDLSVVGCAAHQMVAQRIAHQSITLVRDRAGRLPLHPDAEQRLAVILPHPVDLTPADTSSYQIPQLAPALRTFIPNMDEFILPYAPQEQDIAALLQEIGRYDTLIVGTLNAYTEPSQAALVGAILKTGIPTVVVAMRMPYDLLVFPEAPTYLCSYSIQPPSMNALARALCGQIPFAGCLPVSIPGLYPAGYPQNRTGSL